MYSLESANIDTTGQAYYKHAICTVCDKKKVIKKPPNHPSM